jgi:hypothetical protein
MYLRISASEHNIYEKSVVVGVEYLEHETSYMFSHAFFVFIQSYMTVVLNGGHMAPQAAMPYY